MKCLVNAALCELVSEDDRMERVERLLAADALIRQRLEIEALQEPAQKLTALAQWKVDLLVHGERCCRG